MREQIYAGVALTFCVIKIYQSNDQNHRNQELDICKMFTHKKDKQKNLVNVMNCLLKTVASEDKYQMKMIQKEIA